MHVNKQLINGEHVCANIKYNPMFNLKTVWNMKLQWTSDSSDGKSPWRENLAARFCNIIFACIICCGVSLGDVGWHWCIWYLLVRNFMSSLVFSPISEARSSLKGLGGRWLLPPKLRLREVKTELRPESSTGDFCHSLRKAGPPAEWKHICGKGLSTRLQLHWNYIYLPRCHTLHPKMILWKNNGFDIIPHRYNFN